jgi:hypothetical protein
MSWDTAQDDLQTEVFAFLQQYRPALPFPLASFSRLAAPGDGRKDGWQLSSRHDWER